MSAAKQAADKPSRLGRGLAALIGDMAPVDPARIAEAPGGVRRVPIEHVSANRHNPRRDFDPEQLEDLASSIREKGVMQPLLVRPNKDAANRFEIIAGERRWRAAQKAGLHDIPVIVREVDDKESLELAIIENVQRSDLSPLEEAQGYEQLMAQFSYTQNDLAQVIGKSRSHVANTLRLLRLPDDVRQMLGRGELSAGHARTLVTAADPADLARVIVEDGLSVREAELLAQGAKSPGQGPARRDKPGKSTDALALEKQVSDALGLAVSLTHKGEGGRLEIRYKTLEQLETICARLARA